jgi:hypothetical protein
MRDARVRPGRLDSPREPGRAPRAGGRTGSPADEPSGDEPPAEQLQQIAAGGGTIPLVDVEGEEDRARRATVPSWDDILLGVRRRH